MSIDDILQSVSHVISDKSKILEDDSPYEELELTNIADSQPSNPKQAESLISEKAEKESKKILAAFAETAETLGKDVNIPKDIPPNTKMSQDVVMDLIKPQIKDWLDANLPIIVKQIVSEEIKRLVADMNNNSK